MNLLGVDQIFRCDAEAAGCNLLCLARQRHAVDRLVEAAAVLAAFARIAACAESVHCQGKRFVGLLADGSKRHCSSYEMLYNLVCWLHFVNRNRIFLEREEVAQKYRFCFVVGGGCEFFEFIVVALTGGKLQQCNRFRIPGVALAVFAI